MPIKKDASGKRWVEMELIVPGTPEQVWQALATGPGNTGWFAKTEIDGRVGGVVRFDFGDGSSSVGEVTEWAPPQRFCYVERDWDEDAPPIATEITITARSGGRCVVRMVHSLFTSSDAWDDQVEGFEGGWPGLFQVLRVYLAHFAGQDCECFWVMQQAKLDDLSAWQRLTELVGLTGASVGEQRSGAFGGERWSGVVEHLYQDAKQRYYLVRLLEPGPGIALLGTYSSGETMRVSLSRYFYGDDAQARAARSEPALRAWLASAF